MSEFFNSLLVMFQNDPAAFFTTILSYAGLTTASAGALYGVVRGLITLFNLIFKKKKKLSKIISDGISPLIEQINELKDTTNTKTSTITNMISDFGKITNVIEDKFKNITDKVLEIENKINAFANVVLDNEDLKLKYEVLQREVNNVTNGIENVLSVEEKVEEDKVEVLSIEEELESKKKKIKLKAKE